jgi:hypothetical protein
MTSNSPSQRLLPTVASVLVAALAVMAFAAAGASASTPLMSWMKTPTSLGGTGGAITLETKAGRTVQCSAHTAPMEIRSSTSIHAWLRMTGCNVKGITCTTPGAKSGEVVTSQLNGDLRYVVAGGSQKAAFVLSPSSGTQVTEIACGLFQKYIVSGAVVGVITPTNTSTNTFALTFSQSGGVQDPAGYLAPVGCGVVGATLAVAGGGSSGFPAEQAGLGGVTTVTTGGPVTIAAKTCV